MPRTSAARAFWRQRRLPCSGSRAAPEEAVFQSLNLGHDAGFQRFAAIQTFARLLDDAGLDRVTGRERLQFGARGIVCFVGLAPFRFQMAHLSIELEIETAHGVSLLS